jgi:FlaA1/EpsC-like NDP-sugar epimerase
MESNILITGGAGYFGQAFARTALVRGATRVCIYSRDEAKHARMRDAFDNDSRLRFFVGDIRDERRLEEALYGVGLVVHAAALKRIETGHYNPEEMIETNVLGTRNLIRAVRRMRTAKCVGLSTDKAYAPQSIYGATKLSAECLLLAANGTMGLHGPKFACVRYGNVWNSTGSVVPRWRELVAGGAVTLPVTDPSCTRFFMTVQQAVDLVWDTHLTMKGGELVIPDLPAYQLHDLAHAFGLPYRVTGLPHWEKRHESMSDGNSSDRAQRMTIDELKEALSHV